MKLISVFFLCWFTVQSLSAQKFSGFSQKIEQYPEELSNLMGASVTDKDKQFLADFTTAWQTNIFTEKEKQEIVKISTLIFDKKGRAPQFKALIPLLLTFKNTPNSGENYTTWINFMENFTPNKKTTLAGISAFLETLDDLQKNGFINNTINAQWKYAGEGFKFYVENDSFWVNCPKGSLKCYTKRDSIEIDGTSGLFYPTKKKWIGKGGTVTWERAGYNASEVNAKLNNYQINLTRSEYSADSVVFTYNKYFNTPVSGILNDQVMHLQSPESASYPEFDTYNKQYSFKNLYDNIDYDGGFSMRGAKIVGSGSETEDAKIVVKKNDKILMEVLSKYFVFRWDRINGINTVVKIRVDQDSIYHSDLSFNYYVENKEVSLLRTEEYSSKSPYYDSYHKLDMNFEQLIWRIDQPKIRLTMSRTATIGKAQFQSQNLYNQGQFEELQGRDAVHPLIALYKLSKKINTTRFPAMDYADYIGRPISQVRQVLMSLAQKGFIYYNDKTDEILLKERLFNMLKFNSGKTDFDVIDFASSTQAPTDNAVLDMENYDLTMNGIPTIFLSDSQNVAIHPANNQIIMKQNRSFQFDGIVEAGLFTLYGHNFFFDYDKFKINLQNVDSVVIKVNTGELDNFGKPYTQQLKSVIQLITGELLIDKPDNKSGRHNYPEYPWFSSTEKSYVYYNSHKIENGVYKKDKFFYQIDPFSIDSLDNFSKSGLVFNGKFESAGILPVIEEPLVLQSDYSLGFKYDPGLNGTPIYGGKGQLYAGVQLDSKGLRADGKITHLTSTIESKEFMFYPDSMNTLSDKFAMTQQSSGTEFPIVNSTGNYIHWFTPNDKMYIKKGKTAFNMFNEQTTLTGNLLLEPLGLSGDGKLDMSTADLHSGLFRFKSQIIDADSAKFNLKSLHNKGFTVLTDNVKAHVDFTSHSGDFASNEDYTLVQFPENKYISYLDYFKWNMDAKTLEMGRRKSKTDTLKAENKAYVDDRFSFPQEPEGPRYISTDKKQDSLNFVAPLALYDYENNYLNASGVQVIKVADAVIYPSDGKVTIAETAQMKPLYKTKIIANYIDSFHTIYDANVSIQSRKRFTGTGKYNYIDETEKTQVIDITEIKVDTATHTIATGTITESDNFMLSPFFGFQGKTILNSSKRALFFNGGVNLKTDCEQMNFSWLKFESDIDPKDIYIPVNENPMDINFKKIYTGFFMATDSIHIYPAFLSGRRNYNDQLINTSSGFLHYNKRSMCYEIASKEKLLNHDTIGSYICFYKSNCLAYGEGKLNLGVDLGQLKLTTYGNISTNLISREVLLDVLLGVDFMFDAGALKSMTSKIDSFPNLEGVDINRRNFVKSLNEIMDWKKAAKYREEMTLFGTSKDFPNEINHTLHFTNLSLKWSNSTKSYQSFGKIGIGNIKDHQVNRMVDGFIEIHRRRTGDMMDIYMDLNNNPFYYFGYTRGNMQTFSSSSEFVQIVRDLPLRKRKMKVKRGGTPFIYMVSSDTKFGEFIGGYRRLKGQIQIETPQINQPVDQPIIQPTEQPTEQPAIQQPEKQQQNNQPAENKPTEGEVIEVK
jgi:hypothetical protein